MYIFHVAFDARSAALSLLLVKSIGEGNKKEKLAGQDRDREILTNQHHWKKRCDLRKLDFSP